MGGGGNIKLDANLWEHFLGNFPYTNVVFGLVMTHVVVNLGENTKMISQVSCKYQPHQVSYEVLRCYKIDPVVCIMMMLT